MRPSDPRVRTQLAPARGPLSAVLVAGTVGSALVVAQAFAITGFVVAALDGRFATAWAGIVVAVLAARGLTGWVSDVAAARAAAVVADDMRRRLVGSVLRSATGSGPSRSSGEVSALATRGVAAAEPYLTRYVPALVLATILPVITLVAIATQDLLSAVIVMATLPLIPVFGALVGLATRDRAASQWRAMASLSGHFLDVVRGLPTLVAFRRAEAQSRTIRQITDRYRIATVRTLRIAFASSAVLELVATLSVALVAVTVGVRLAAGHLDLGTALVVLLLAPEAYWPLRRVGAEFHAAAEGAACFEELAALDQESHAQSPDIALPPGPIELSDITVVHPGRTTPALAAISAVIPDRGVTVITGPSGCGKSTTLAVIAGLITPTSGTLRVGGLVLADGAMRQHVALLPQRPVFVSGTVADNLRLARVDASDDDLWTALRQVALEERVRDLPGALDAAMAEDARTLSAGERARLALARVVVARRPWVLLDEPTAHLDPLTEQVIADTIVELARTSGVLVVAHRPALVQLADLELRLVGPPRPRTISVATAQRGPDRLVEAPPNAAPDRPSLKRALAISTVIGTLASASGVALTATAGWLIVQASQQPPVLTLMVAIVGVRAFGLARPVLRYVERLRSHDAALRLLAERRVQVYDAVVPLTPGCLGKRRGDVLVSIVDDVDAVVDHQLRVRMPLLTWCGVAAGAVAVAFLVLPVGGLVLAVTSLLSATLGYGVASRAAGSAERRTVQARAELSERVVEVIQVAPELVMWQRGDAAAEDVTRASRALTLGGVGSAKGVATARAVVLLATGVGIAAMGLFAAPAVADNTLSGPMFALLVLLPLALLEVTQPVVDAAALSARTRAADARLKTLESMDPAVTSPSSPCPPDSMPTLELVDVDAGWAGSTALHHLSLSVGAGERIGVIGASGSGKSTLAALLLRFIDPQRGEVRLGRVPMPALALHDVRREVGLVDDDPHIFASTLVENIRLARPEARDDEVEGALRQASLGPWLDSLPDGLQTWLGDGHAQLSGGERARVAVTRSLLAAQPVLVLDEPTAHLDSATAADLVREVLDTTPGRTVVWITHGSAGLDRMDRVIDLDETTMRPTARSTI